MESIMAVFADFKSRAVAVIPEQSKIIIEGHEALVNAIVTKKKKLAVDLLEKDLANARKILLGNT